MRPGIFRGFRELLVGAGAMVAASAALWLGIYGALLLIEAGGRTMGWWR